MVDVSSHAWVVDLLHIPQALDVDVVDSSGGQQQQQKISLRSLLQHEEILKVGHDLRSDLDALLHQAGVDVRPVFDTQVADVLGRRLLTAASLGATRFVQGSAKLFARFQIPMQILPGSVVGGGELTQERKLQIHALFSEDRHLWERRPLPEGMVE